MNMYMDSESSTPNTYCFVHNLIMIKTRTFLKKYTTVTLKHEILDTNDASNTTVITSMALCYFRSFGIYTPKRNNTFTHCLIFVCTELRDVRSDARAGDRMFPVTHVNRFF